MNDRTAKPVESAARRLPWWLLGIIVVVFAFALFGDRGILHLFKQKRQQDDLQRQLAQVEETNAGLRRQISALTSDRRQLERMARSQLGMVREDEIVYQFAGKERPATPAPAAVR